MRYNYLIPTMGIERLTTKEGVPCYSNPINCFVAFVRANNYPHMACSTMQYENAPFYGICTEELESDPMSLYSMWVYRLENDEQVNFYGEKCTVERYDGVAFVQSDRIFKVLVDGHLYYITFFEF